MAVGRALVAVAQLLGRVGPEVGGLLEALLVRVQLPAAIEAAAPLQLVRGGWPRGRQRRRRRHDDVVARDLNGGVLRVAVGGGRVRRGAGRRDEVVVGGERDAGGRRLGEVFVCVGGVGVGAGGAGGSVVGVEGVGAVGMEVVRMAVMVMRVSGVSVSVGVVTVRLSYWQQQSALGRVAATQFSNLCLRCPQICRW